MNETLDVVLTKNKTTLSFIALHMQEKIKCIELGMSFLSAGTQIFQCWTDETLSHKIKKLQQEIEKEKTKYQQLLSTHEEEKEYLSVSIRSSESIRYKEDICRQQEKIDMLERKLEEEMDKYRALYQQLMNDFERQSSSREMRYEEKIRNLEKRLEDQRKVHENVQMRGQNSTFLGQDGEELTREALNCLFPKAEVIDTHAQGGKGDFVLKEDNICCLIETKNHKTNVGRGDIDKFYTDIEHNADIQCGIFASLKSGVVNRNDFHLEFRNKKPILFLTHVKHNMKHMKIALMIFRLLINLKHLDMTEKEKIDRVKHIIPVIKRKWTSLRTTLTTFQTTMLQLIDEQESDIKTLLSI